MDVYFYEAFEEEARLIEDLLQGKLLFDLTDRTIQESGDKIPPARLISIRTQSVIPEDWQSELDGVLSRTTGFDNLKAYQKAIKTPVALGYLEEYATRAVAEQAILLMLSLLRRLPQQIQQFRHFQRDGLTGLEALGRNLLVVGVGRIGGETVRMAQPLGLNVRGVDIVQRHDFVHYVQPEDGLAWADIIICAMNLTDQNVHYFSYDLLKKRVLASSSSTLPVVSMPPFMIFSALFRKATSAGWLWMFLKTNPCWRPPCVPIKPGYQKKPE